MIQIFDLWTVSVSALARFFVSTSYNYPFFLHKHLFFYAGTDFAYFCHLCSMIQIAFCSRSRLFFTSQSWEHIDSVREKNLVLKKHDLINYFKKKITITYSRCMWHPLRTKKGLHLFFFSQIWRLLCSECASCNLLLLQNNPTLSVCLCVCMRVCDSRASPQPRRPLSILAPINY